jgi:hypothetical protein
MGLRVEKRFGRRLRGPQSAGRIYNEPGFGPCSNGSTLLTLPLSQRPKGSMSLGPYSRSNRNT